MLREQLGGCYYPDMQSKFITDNIDSIVGEFNDLLARSKHDDCSDVMSVIKANEMMTRTQALVDLATPRESAYRRQIQSILTKQTRTNKLKCSE